MMRRALALVAVATIAFGGSVASAHRDHTADGNNSSTKRCDTWWRDGHAKDANGKKETQSGFDRNTAHSEDHTSEFDDEPLVAGQGRPNTLLAPTGIYTHRHTGHYVVRHDAFYVEVVGGGGYNQGGNQGGYVQGEVDPGSGAPDADFHTHTFAGTAGSMHSEAACVSVADNKVGNQG